MCAVNHTLPTSFREPSKRCFLCEGCHNLIIASFLYKEEKSCGGAPRVEQKTHFCRLTKEENSGASGLYSDVLGL